MNECEHMKIMTFFDHDTGEPVSLWACSECDEKFVPLSDLMRVEKRLAEAKAKIRQLEDAP